MPFDEIKGLKSIKLELQTEQYKP